MSDFKFRDDTMDEWIFHSVMHDNEYDLPDEFAATDVVLDIGGHIGSFSHACLVRGAGEVHVFEPDPGNYECLCTNLQPLWGDRVQAHNEAVWKSGQNGRTDELRHSGYSGQNTGGGNVVSGQGEPVTSVRGLDNILESIGRPVRIMKIDAEFSEFPILFTSRLFASRVMQIVGEVHEMGGAFDDNRVSDVMMVDGFIPPYTIGMLKNYLDGLGYDVTYHRLDPKWQVIFTATSRTLPAS